MLPEYIIQKLIAENHPVIEPDRCINKKQRKKACTVCKDICPQGVYESGAGPDWDRCENCGLCVSACPSRCLTFSAFNLENYLSLLTEGIGSIRIACKSANVRTDLTVSCLAALPWEFMACAALLKDLEICVGGCGSCGHQNRVSLFKSSGERAKQFLGEEYFDRHVKMVEAVEELPEKSYSRRELFGLFSEHSKSALSKVSSLFIKNKTGMDGLIFRKLLHKLAKEKKDGAFYWLAPAYSANCRVCGICGKLCPQSAACFETKDGNSRISIVPWKCNACELCQFVCPNGGISGMQAIPVKDLSLLQVHQI